MKPLTPDRTMAHEPPGRSHGEYRSASARSLPDEAPPPDWLDHLLGAAAAQAPAPDGEFSATVMRRLPPAHSGLAAPARAGVDGETWHRLLGACAAGLCVAVLLLLLPDAAEVLTRGSSPVEWLARSALERLLPPLVVAAWLCWWSLRQAVVDG
jgi:hypothetical protein